MRTDLRVPMEKLRRVFDPDNFGFETTADIEPSNGFIGQDRAVEALQMGLRMDSPEYNIFIVDGTGISRRSVLLRFLREFAEKKKAAALGAVNLNDICYVFNFDNPGQPRVLLFERGEGRVFKKAIAELLKELKVRIPLFMKSDEFCRAKELILEELNNASEHNLQLVHDQVTQADCLVAQTQFSSPRVFPASRMAPDKPMSSDEGEALPQEEREAIENKIKILQNNLDIVFQCRSEDEKRTQQKIDALEKQHIRRLLEDLLKDLLEKHTVYTEAVSYLNGVHDFVLDNANLFKEDSGPVPQGPDHFLPFHVNLIIDHSETETIPIVFAENPNFGNLFGRIERYFVQGVLLTDHSRIKAGSLLAAHGGCLVLKIADVLRYPGVWEKLERTIRYGSLKIEDPMSSFGFYQTNMDPGEIPVNLKVILVGEPMLYHLLVRHDPEFQAIFKIKAEFDSEMPVNQANQAAYAAFIALCCGKEDDRRLRNGLLPFDRTAVAKILEYGLRLAGTQSMFSTEFNRVKELIVEADYWAEKLGSRAVTAEHVIKALASQRLRVNLHETKLQGNIRKELLLIDTDGAKVGQINGLAVYSLGDYFFGKPTRITVQTFLGKAGLVSIDREEKIAGPIHNKGVHILSGYFGGVYGNEKPISFSASICFEQSYGIEGDSASAAELFCLLSSLSRVPIRQGIAVTGSVNQRGEIQPVGGVNEKIEGFFDVCLERGLTGEQGVIIPYSNVQNLMLSEEVVTACRDGKFWISAIKTVDEGMEIVMDTPAPEIQRLVSEHLANMTKLLEGKKAPNES